MTSPLGHRVFGSGRKTVIFLHEWLGHHDYWMPLLPYLSKDKARWVLADLRGYGWSRNLKGDFSLDEAVGDVLALADHLKAKRFHVVGHSMGGLVAQAVAAAAPRRVASLTLVCPVPASGFAADKAALARMQKVLTDDRILRDAIHARTGNRLGEGWIARKSAIARKAGTRAAQRGYLNMFTGSDISGLVKGLDVPVRLIAGKHDLPFYGMAAQKKRFSKCFSNLDAVEISEAGHYPMLETPVRLAGLIEDWVRLPSRRP
ncbi:putative hydrolase or acyltransferase of alpha/beta superfamily [Rhodospirillaceae bacterium LM-1]|nr:putative hydrolase or acyltransferase of alpha/beta superfamily [Rhodospirillaceae bacterium LM-1]